MDKFEVKNYDPIKYVLVNVIGLILIVILKVSAHSRVIAWMRTNMDPEACPKQSRFCILISSSTSRYYPSHAIVHHI